MSYQTGGVYHYTSDRKDRWCREEVAIVDASGVLMDTYWRHGSDDHRLTDSELATAEFVFNLSDYDELSHHEACKWHDYNPADRQVVTSQHGLSRRYFIRKGSAPDLSIKIQNARDAVADAEQKVSDAESRLEWRRRELAELEASE